MDKQRADSSGTKRPIQHDDDSPQDEIKRLKAELMLKDELLKKLEKKKTVSGFLSKEESMVNGFEYFLLGNKNAKKVGENYQDWYKCMLHKLQKFNLYEYKEHLFFKVVFEKQANDVTFECGESGDEGYDVIDNRAIIKCDNDGDAKVFADIYSKDWTADVMVLVVILHPNDLTKVNEMDCSNTYYDEIDKTTSDSWTTSSVTNEYYSDNKELIICCKRKPKD
jgi:hypothetical protein